MSKSLKEQIVGWMLHDRSFETGRLLFDQNSKHEGLKRKLALQGETPDNVQALHYQLMKLCGVSEQDWRRMMRQKVLVLVSPRAGGEAGAGHGPGDGTGSEAGDGSGAESGSAEATGAEHLPVTSIDQIPEDVKRAIRLRDDFPFLKLKTCPDELKILVADMLTCHDTYVAAHDALFAATSPQEIATLSQNVVENYLENREIWDELQVYKQTGKPLGKHLVWQRKARLEELRAMSMQELVKLAKNLPTNITRNRQKVTDDPDSPETASRLLRVEQYTWELEEVNKLISANG